MSKIIRVESCGVCTLTKAGSLYPPCPQCIDDPTPALEARVKELEEENGKLWSRYDAICQKTPHNRVLEARVKGLEMENTFLRTNRKLEIASLYGRLNDKNKEIALLHAALDIAAVREHRLRVEFGPNAKYMSAGSIKQDCLDEAKRRMK